MYNISKPSVYRAPNSFYFNRLWSIIDFFEILVYIWYIFCPKVHFSFVFASKCVLGKASKNKTG